MVVNGSAGANLFLATLHFLWPNTKKENHPIYSHISPPQLRRHQSLLPLRRPRCIFLCPFKSFAKSRREPTTRNGLVFHSLTGFPSKAAERDDRGVTEKLDSVARHTRGILFPLPVSSRSLSVAREGKPRTLDPQPARSGRLLQSHTLMERRRGERLGRRGGRGGRDIFPLV